MNAYQIIQPSVLLAPYVKQYWFLTFKNVARASQRLIPAGNIVLNFHRGEPVYSSAHHGIQPKASLNGQMTIFTDLVYEGNVNFIGIVFRPAGAIACFNLPINELTNRNIDITALNDTQLMELEKRLVDIKDNEKCVELIEKFLMKRIYSFEDYNHQRVMAVMQSIDYGENDISSLAKMACLGYKQFKRVFTQYIGINPKDYLQIIRFQKTLHRFQLQPEISVDKLAEYGGYYDRSHFIKEMRMLMGYTPKEFLSVCDPYEEQLSVFRSTMIDPLSIKT